MAKKPPMTAEEKLIRAEQLAREKEERARIKAARIAGERAAKKKVEPTEEELVHRYVNRTIRNQQYHGRVDENKFQGLGYDKSVSKNIWLDTDFYASIVFQSEKQKYHFFRQLIELAAANGVVLEIEKDEQVQIVNGIRLSKALGFAIYEEETKDFPTGNLDLMQFVLDTEEVNPN